MKKLCFILVMICSTAWSFGQTAVWKDDPDHTKLTFTVTHQGISSVLGLFQKFEVTIKSSKADFSDVIFGLTVDVASVNTEAELRDEHLRGAGFFNVAKYPTITFKSTSILNTTGMKDRYRLTGDLTIHGVTKSVSMDLWFRGTNVDGVSKKIKAGFQLTGIINRADFGVGVADPFDVSTDVIIKADGEFLKQQ